MVKPETPEEAHDRALRELEGKNIQHYGVLLSAWIQTRMQRDKTLVALSAAAIGLMVTILTTTGVQKGWLLVPYVTAFLGFGATIWSALRIYQRNSEKIEQDMKGASAPDYREINLAPYDRVATWGFGIGALSAIAVAFSSATLSYLDARDSMPKDKVETTAAPKPEDIRSFQGIEALKPQAPEVEAPSQEAALESTPSQEAASESTSAGASPPVPSESE